MTCREPGHIWGKRPKNIRFSACALRRIGKWNLHGKPPKYTPKTLYNADDFLEYKNYDTFGCLWERTHVFC